MGVLIFLLNKNGTLSYNLKGIALLLFAVFAAVGYNLTLSRLVGRYSPAYIVSVQNIIGATLFLPIFMILDFNTFIHHTYTPLSFWPIIALAAFASTGAFILFAYSVSKIGILKANVFTNFIPLVTALFSFILMGDKLTFQNIIGMIVVITGILMAQLDGRIDKVDEALVLTGKTA